LEGVMMGEVVSVRPQLPVTAFISASLFFTGITYASTLPYAGIAAIDGLGMSNGAYALILTVSSLVSAAAAVALGYLSDRIGDRRLLVVATALLGALGYGLIYFARNPLAYIVAYCVIVPFGGALFSQTFSFARSYYNAHRPDRAEFLVTILQDDLRHRLGAGPASGRVDRGELCGVRRLRARSGGLSRLRADFRRAAHGRNDAHRRRDESRGNGGAGGERDRAADAGGDRRRAAGHGGDPAQRHHRPARHRQELRRHGGGGRHLRLACGAARDSLHAGLGIRAQRYKKHWLIAASGLVYAVYLYLLGQAQTVVDVYWLQGFNAVATAGLMSIPISYMQEAIRGRVGLSTSLLDVSTVASRLIAAGALRARNGERRLPADLSGSRRRCRWGASRCSTSPTG
jgi:MFS transporter, SET family, sugar efflux transporter